MKGFLSIAGDSRRFVFQGVHMLFDGQPDRPWGDLKRQNQLVFIGRNLDEEGMRQGFEACLVWATNLKACSEMAGRPQLGITLFLVAGPAMGNLLSF